MELVSVQCYSGHTYAQEPRAFTWHGATHQVERVERAWRTPDGPAFAVAADDGQRYTLYYNEARDQWFIKAGLTMHTEAAAL